MSTMKTKAHWKSNLYSSVATKYVSNFERYVSDHLQSMANVSTPWSSIEPMIGPGDEMAMSDFAFELLEIEHEKDLKMILDTMWTSELIDLLLHIIELRPSLYSFYFLFAIGNATASPDPPLCQRILSNRRFPTLLHTLLAGEYDYMDDEDIFDKDSCGIAMWIITNIFQSCDRLGPTQVVESINPVTILGTIEFIKIYLDLMNGSARIGIKDERRVKTLSFRCLSAIFIDPITIGFMNDRSITSQAVEYKHCYDQYLSLVLDCEGSRSNDVDMNDNVEEANVEEDENNEGVDDDEFFYDNDDDDGYHDYIKDLLLEYKVGLMRAPLYDTGFYPDAYDRALTCQYLLMNPIFQSRLVRDGVIDMLKQSLQMVYKGNERNTLLLWTRAIASLFYLTKTNTYHRELVNHNMLSELSSLATGRFYERAKYSFISRYQTLALPVRKMAASVIISLGISWETQRLLLIGVTKEQASNCLLAKLPVELVRKIMMWYVLLGGLYDEKSICIIREVSSQYRAYQGEGEDWV